MGHAAKAERPKLGDVRFLVEMIDTANVEAMARKQGWRGTDDPEAIREYCEPEDAAVHSAHGSLDDAVRAARKWLAKGTSFYGCVIIDHEIFERCHDDRGNAVKHFDWERQCSYEVTADDSEIIKVEI